MSDPSGTEKEKLATVKTQQAAEDQLVSSAVDALNDFGFRFYSQIAAKNKDENAFFSPLSISLAFALAYEGAKEDTSEEIRSVFGFEDDDKMRRSFFATLIKKLNNPNGYTLNVANAVWVMEGYKYLLPEYRQILQRDYESELRHVNFLSPTGVDVMNQWVVSITNDKIQSALPPDPLDKDTRLILMNIIYFKASWSEQFQVGLTREVDFNISTGRTTKVRMMHAVSWFRYADTGDVQILELMYQGDVSMLILLPRAGLDFSQVEKTLTISQLESWEAQLEIQRIRVYIPKFKLKSEYRLEGILQAMGIRRAFDRFNANLTGMTTSETPDEERLYIALAIHKAFVEVDEKGTEASGVTGVRISARGSGLLPPAFIADRPFFFVVRDKRSKSILFMGRLVNPIIGS